MKPSRLRDTRCARANSRETVALTEPSAMAATEEVITAEECRVRFSRFDREEEDNTGDHMGGGGEGYHDNLVPDLAATPAPGVIENAGLSFADLERKARNMKSRYLLQNMRRRRFLHHLIYCMYVVGSPPCEEGRRVFVLPSDTTTKNAPPFSCYCHKCKRWLGCFGTPCRFLEPPKDLPSTRGGDDRLDDAEDDDGDGRDFITNKKRTTTNIPRGSSDADGCAGKDYAIRDDGARVGATKEPVLLVVNDPGTAKADGGRGKFESNRSGDSGSEGEDDEVLIVYAVVPDRGCLMTINYCGSAVVREKANLGS